jgi:capsular polysaccharide biosynthesis protein
MTSSTIDLPAQRRRAEGSTVSRRLVSTGKRWVVLAVALAASSAIGGAYLGAQAPVEYTSEARLAVGSTSLRSLSVPGYVQATEQLASTYARYVNTNASELDTLADGLGVEPGSLVSVQSSPIAESNIVRIQVVATSPAAGSAAADALATRLVSAVNAPDKEKRKARAQLAYASTQAAQSAQAVDDAQVALTDTVAVWQRRHPDAADVGVAPQGPAVDAAKQELAQARSQLSLDQVDLESATSTFRELSSSEPADTDVRVVQPAVLTRDSTTETTQWGALGGLGVGLLLGGVLLAVTVRRRPRAAE